MVPFIKDNGKVMTNMALVYAYIQMVQSMKGFGKIICHMEKVSFSTLTVMFLKAIGKTAKSKVMVNILRQIVPNMKDIGIIIKNMDMEKKFGKMVQFMRVRIKMV